MNKKIQNQSSHGSHMPLPSDRENTRALKIAGWLTGVYFFIELGVGFWTGSISVISDAFHTFSAVGGVLIAVVAGYYAKRTATQFQTYGLMRAEIVGALLNGVFLFAMAILVMWMGAMRLQNPIELETGPMLLIAIGGLITEVISIRLMWRGQKENLNMRGAFWHILQTFVGSIIIIISALVIQFTGFLAIDPLLGMAFGLVLFWAAWKIIKDALHILLEGVPKDLDIETIQKAIIEVSGVKNIHHIHAWALTSGKNVMSAHVKIADEKDTSQIQKDIYTILSEEFGIYFSTIQLEVECLEENESEAINYLSDNR